MLSDPASIVHFGAAWLNRAARARSLAALAGWRRIAPGFDTWTPATLVPLAGSLGAGSAALLDLWPHFALPSVIPRLRREGYEAPDLLLLDGALYASLADNLSPGKIVFRIFDHPDGRTGLPEELRRRESALISRVDLVAVTAAGLVSVATAAGARKVHLLENGVDPTAFSQAARDPCDLAAIPRPRAIYAGAIEPWVDQDLVNEVARLCPDISFIWIGPGRARPATPDPSNVYRLGAKPYASLPSYLVNADVGLIPFDRARHTALVDTINPLKLYEYAAAGLPVVATPWKELERIGGPVIVASDANSFAAAVRTAVDTPCSDAAKSFAQTASWQQRVANLLTSAGLDTGSFSTIAAQ
jgi:glycosyltransferase involved in cell wall biosynthesis